MLSLKDRLYYKILPLFLRVAERCELPEYTRQKARIPLLPLPQGGGGRAYLFLTHGRGGGVDKYVEKAAALAEAEGWQAWILHFHPLKRRFVLSRTRIHSESAVHFKFPAQYADMIAHLRILGISMFSIQHTRYLPFRLLQDLPEFAGYLGAPYNYMMHDFIAICPRVHLIDGDFSYCGMPQDANACDACIRKNGMLTVAPENATAWREAHRALLAQASELNAPSHDTADRHNHILGDLKINVIPHDSPPLIRRTLPAKQKGEAYIVAVVGRIHRHKGADVLLACARDAKRRKLPLIFKVIGDSVHARKLRAAGVSLTGIYQETELPGLLRESNASLAFLPSVWPETYSYVLSHLQENAYFPVAFDLGAPAERIKATNNGLVLPAGMIHSPMLINDFLIKAARQQHAS